MPLSQLFKLQVELAVFNPGTSIMHERMRDKLWLFRLAYLKAILSEMKSAHHLKENNRQYLLLVSNKTQTFKLRSEF